MNILLLNINTRSWGGIESYADVLASILLDRGHNVMVSSRTDNPLVLKSTGAVIRTAKIRIHNSGDIIAIFKIIKLCLNANVDLIIAHHGKDFWPATLAAKISRRRIMIIRHQTVRLKKTTCWLLNQLVDRVVAVSHAVKDSLVVAGVSDNKIFVIHNCIALNRFDPDRIDPHEIRKELGIDGSDTVVGTVGKLHRDKGVYDLLYAFSGLTKKYRFLKLLFVGSARNGKILKGRRRDYLYVKRLFLRA